VCEDPACASLTVTTVDDTADAQVGQWTSLVLDASGNPRISYSSDPDVGDSGLKLAVCHDPTCSTSTLRLVDNPLNQTVGDHSSMVLDGDGYPVIAYHSHSSGKLKLAHCDDATCSTATITDVHEQSPMALGKRVSLALDAAGNPIMSYIEYAPSVDLWLAHCTDPNCTTAPTLQEIVTGDILPATRSMVLDPAGNPIIAYYERVDDDLKVVHCDDPTCATSTINTVDSTDEVGSDLAMALNAVGNPVISYYDITHGDLKLALCHDPDCSDATVVVLQSGGDTGKWTSLTLDVAGNPIVAYFDDENDELRLAALML
ncbi:MAG: hypothetical protein MUP76_01110, partial [Acidimicrobiia bacterium]|nr:hypothetical protein [Acidimicrobiia bacterium]